jgi:hypothetical protein
MAIAFALLYTLHHTITTSESNSRTAPGGFDPCVCWPCPCIVVYFFLVKDGRPLDGMHGNFVHAMREFPTHCRGGEQSSGTEYRLGYVPSSTADACAELGLPAQLYK